MCVVVAQQINSFLLLPVEVCVEILSFCEIADISSFARTCKFCSFLVGNNLLWQKKIEKKWPKKVPNEEEHDLHCKDLYFKWNFEDFLRDFPMSKRRISPDKITPGHILQHPLGSKQCKFASDPLIGPLEVIRIRKLPAGIFQVEGTYVFTGHKVVSLFHHVALKIVAVDDWQVMWEVKYATFKFISVDTSKCTATIEVGLKFHVTVPITETQCEILEKIQFADNTHIKFAFLAGKFKPREIFKIDLERQKILQGKVEVFSGGLWVDISQFKLQKQ